MMKNVAIQKIYFLRRQATFLVEHFIAFWVFMNVIQDQNMCLLVFAFKGELGAHWSCPDSFPVLNFVRIETSDFLSDNPILKILPTVWNDKFEDFGISITHTIFGLI